MKPVHVQLIFILVEVCILLRIMTMDIKIVNYFTDGRASEQVVAIVHRIGVPTDSLPSGENAREDTLTEWDHLRSYEDLNKLITEPCSYKVQVYDRDDVLAKKRIKLKLLVDNAKRGPTLRADVQCGNNCIVEVTIADGQNNYEGMDAVIFHLNREITPNPAPPVDTNPNQTWVFVSWESPWLNKAEPELSTTRLTADAFWTYHRSSDITTRYGFYKPGIPMINETKTTTDWLKGKTKLVVWIASNCIHTSWPRTRFVNRLNEDVPVDMYGACGNLTCQPRWSFECTVNLVRTYKFYLSLENSECEDYITEKVWKKPLMQGVVPIVYGPKRKVYEELLPPNSFIYIGDFKNVKALANYLKLLNTHPKMYAKYFEWQYEGSVGVSSLVPGPYDPALFCSLVPVIEKVRRGELTRRMPVLEGTFSQTCRKMGENVKRTKSKFGVDGSWNPW